MAQSMVNEYHLCLNTTKTYIFEHSLNYWWIYVHLNTRKLWSMTVQNCQESQGNRPRNGFINKDGYYLKNQFCKDGLGST